jgi:hypothetical protein
VRRSWAWTLTGGALLWQARLPAVAALLVLQTLAVQLLFYTRW